MAIERNRLSSIDLLPEEAEADIVWALEEIADGKRLQKDIWAEFNARLGDKGVGSISHSAFGRYALRKRRTAARLKEARDLAGALRSTQDTEADDDITVMIAAMLKELMFTMLDGGKVKDTKSAVELARSLQATVAAQSISSTRRKKLEADIEAKVEETVDAVAKATGLSAERAAEIRREVLGLRK